MSQWNDISFRIIRQTDNTIYHATLEALSKNSFTPGNFSLTTEASPTPLNQSNQDEVAEILKMNTYVVRKFEFTTPFPFSITITREASLDSVTLNLSNINGASHRYGTPPPRPTHMAALALAANLRIALKAIDLDASTNIKETLSTSLHRHYEVREAELARLEAMASNIARTAAEEAARLRIQAEETIQAKAAELQAEYKSKNLELTQQHQEKFKLLEQQEKNLQARLREVDDAENKHARRSIRKELKEELERRNKEFKLTAGTRRLRIPIFAFAILLLIFFGCGFGFSLYFNLRALTSQASLPTTQIVASLVEQLAFAVAFASTSVFFIRWTNRWFQVHADEEFRQKRFDLDLDRASWIVEMAMEWRGENGTEIPPELLERLSGSLFVEKGTIDEPLHPVDQVASALFGAAAEASLELPGGTKVKLDRKSMKNLAKAKQS